MNQTQYEDKEIGAKHGDVFVTENGRIYFRFRYGPVQGYWWRPKNCPRSRRAWGSYRYPKTLNSLRMDEAHRLEGFRIAKKKNGQLPTAWDDIRSHNEKCWKRHRKTQYKLPRK